MINTTSKDDELSIRQRIVNCFNGDDFVPTGAINNLEKLIKQYGIQERIDELGGVQLDYGNRVAQTFINGEAMTVTERYEQLTALKAKGGE